MFVVTIEVSLASLVPERPLVVEYVVTAYGRYPSTTIQTNMDYDQVRNPLLDGGTPKQAHLSRSGTLDSSTHFLKLSGILPSLIPRIPDEVIIDVVF